MGDTVTTGPCDYCEALPDSAVAALIRVRGGHVWPCPLCGTEYTPGSILD